MKKFDRTYFEKYGDAENPQPYAQVYKSYTIDTDLVRPFVFKHPKVVDLGAADGRLLQDYHRIFKGPESNYSGVEISKYAVDNKIFGNIELGDVVDYLKRHDNNVDIVICNMLMYCQNGQHVETILKAIHRALNVTGVVALTIYSIWRYGEFNDGSIKWEDAYLTCRYKNRQLIDEDNGRNVTFAAPKLWWLYMLKNIGFDVAAQNAGMDSLICQLATSKTHTPPRPILYAGIDSEDTGFFDSEDTGFFNGKVNQPFYLVEGNVIVNRFKYRLPSTKEDDQSDTRGTFVSENPMKVDELRFIVNLIRQGIMGIGKGFRFKLDKSYDYSSHVAYAFCHRGYAVLDREA